MDEQEARWSRGQAFCASVAVLSQLQKSQTSLLSRPDSRPLAVGRTEEGQSGQLG